MYDDRPYGRREPAYEQPPYPPGQGRPREGAPPGPESYPPERDYPPEPGRGPPPGPAPGGYGAPPPVEPAPPPRRKYKRPLKPNEIPKMFSFLAILGILFMFIGLSLMTFAIPTTPPPERPKGDDEDDWEDYGDAYDDWSVEYYNAKRNSEMIKQVGIFVHYLGTMLAGIALVGGGLLLNDLDMKLRTTLIILGTVLVIVMFIVPYGWMQVSPLT